MSKKYVNMGDFNEDTPKKKRMTLNPFENMFTKDGKGIEKGELKVIDKPTLGNFFKLLRRTLNHIFSTNILLIAGNFPIFFALFAFAYTTTTVSGPSSMMFPLVRGMSYFDNSPNMMSMIGIYGKQDTMSINTTATNILLGLTLLVFITFGLVTVGTTYISRNLVRGEPVFVMSDFWYAIKRNWKQGIIYGIIDLLLMGILVYDIVYYSAGLGTIGLFTTMYVAGIGMLLVYSFVRTYAYLMIVTFDMKLTKILKNSLFFAVLGIKRNIMALFGTILVVGLNILLINVFMPVGMVIPFIILFGLIQFMGVYAAFPKIKEIMIDPYYNEIEKKESAEPALENSEI